MYSNNEFSPTSPFLQGLRVLFVDDNIDCCDLIARTLQNYGMEVQTAFSVQQALETFIRWQPDILVSDIALPKEDGYALIHQVRKLTGKLAKSVPAIAMTSCVNEQMHQRTMLAGFDLWVPKPVDIDELVAMLGILAIRQKSSSAIALGSVE
jgi:two-component system, OmpR family, response regulator